jgi:hypothetical protein
MARTEDLSPPRHFLGEDKKKPIPLPPATLGGHSLFGDWYPAPRSKLGPFLALLIVVLSLSHTVNLVLVSIKYKKPY